VQGTPDPIRASNTRTDPNMQYLTQFLRGQSPEQDFAEIEPQKA
jgi:hypothetical protein